MQPTLSSSAVCGKEMPDPKAADTFSPGFSRLAALSVWCGGKRGGMFYGWLRECIIPSIQPKVGTWGCGGSRPKGTVVLLGQQQSLPDTISSCVHAPPSCSYNEACVEGTREKGSTPQPNQEQQRMKQVALNVIDKWSPSRYEPDKC